jgi:hypothetical protein
MAIEIDQGIYDLYDEYCHGAIDRREFLKRAALVTAGGLAMAQALLPRYARAQTVSFTDPRIQARYVGYPSPGGNSGTMRGYLVRPAAQGPFPAVLVIHENRGLNPYIEDVARRLAVEGFLALAPDGLAPVGGYPGNDDDGRELQAKLDQAKLRILLGRRDGEPARGRARGGASGWGGVLRRGPAARSSGADPRATAAELRRPGPAHQRHVAGLRGGAQGGRRALRSLLLPGHPARLPQQFDAALPRGGGKARLVAHRRLLQEEPFLSFFFGFFFGLFFGLRY